MYFITWAEQNHCYSQKPNIHQKYVVIDHQTIWYGSINLLSYGTAEESIMRLQSRELAVELEEKNREIIMLLKKYL